MGQIPYLYSNHTQLNNWMEFDQAHQIHCTLMCTINMCSNNYINRQWPWWVETTIVKKYVPICPSCTKIPSLTHMKYFTPTCTLYGLPNTGPYTNIYWGWYHHNCNLHNPHQVWLCHKVSFSAYTHTMSSHEPYVVLATDSNIRWNHVVGHQIWVLTRIKSYINRFEAYVVTALDTFITNLLGDYFTIVPSVLPWCIYISQHIWSETPTQDLYIRTNM